MSEQTVEKDAWHEKHQGAYLYTWGEVWTCEDDCGCSQAQVTDFYQNKVVHNARASQ